VHETAERNGLAAFTGAALIRGAGTRTFQEIVEETESLGCSVNAGGGVHGSGFGGKALAEDLPLVLEILADLVQRPTFPAHEVERLRGQFLTGLRENEQDTQTQASRAVRKVLFPTEHPYSRMSSGTIDTVSAITRDDLVAFHKLYHPAVTTIVVVGDVQPDTVIALLEQYFGGWEPAGPPPTLDFPPVPPLTGITRNDIAMQGKVQSDVIWAVHGLNRFAPDYYAAMLGNMILGRLGMGGRLGDNVREEQGMAYYCQSGFDADLGAGPWFAIAGVNPANVDRAIEAILHEIEVFKADGPTDQELDDAKAYLTGSLVLGLETSDGIAGTLMGIERYHLGLDYIVRYPDIINGITHAAIVAAVRNYLTTDRYTLAVAGPG
jgi:zinc protease